jgi:hypothetical protein
MMIGGFFIQLMYDTIGTLADKLEETVTNMNAHEARQQQEVDLESIELLALAKTRTQSENRNSKTQMSKISRGSGSQSDCSSSESEKLRRKNWKDTQECYRCHQMGHIARHCSSTAPVESGAPTDTAAAAAATTMTMTSIENY